MDLTAYFRNGTPHAWLFARGSKFGKYPENIPELPHHFLYGRTLKQTSAPDRPHAAWGDLGSQRKRFEKMYRGQNVQAGFVLKCWHERQDAKEAAGRSSATAGVIRTTGRMKFKTAIVKFQNEPSRQECNTVAPRFSGGTPGLTFHENFFAELFGLDKSAMPSLGREKGTPAGFQMGLRSSAAARSTWDRHCVQGAPGPCRGQRYQRIAAHLETVTGDPRAVESEGLQAGMAGRFCIAGRHEARL